MANSATLDFDQFVLAWAESLDLELRDGRPQRDTTLTDLGIDSIGMLESYEWLAGLGVDLPEEHWAVIRTVGDLHEWYCVKAGQS